ncbi:diguanylate cyclase [Kordiimonas sp. SCSIO 12610]|uniref:sensor domain-containing diguanylate cyclase n=1 Tax=Kordiimonas sp. SCSIO 12610 TaxID=2829597 RepID=UPI002108B892|nr:diguanylate cyclase [Kordiimonas sp. SCSIO 12610]UTW55177.1 diguanylate cyclase [Kordiimonas sp. SCSIO 12610]
MDILKNKRPKLDTSKAAVIAINSKGIVVDSSPSAENLMIGWNAGHEGLHVLVKKVAETNIPLEDRLSFHDQIKLWVSVVKIGDLVYVTGRDTTLSDQVTDALLKSRILLKELLDNAVDLAFEVDKNREILFVSPAKAFGVETDVWIGENADKIFWSDVERPTRSPLSVKNEQTFDAVQVKIQGTEERRWVKIVSQPYRNNDGSITVRGTMVDTTQQVRRERMMRAMNLRFKVQERITNILNTAETAEDLMTRASKALVEVLRADSVWLLEKLGRDLVTRASDSEDVLPLDAKAILSEANKSSAQNLIKINHENQVYLVIQVRRGAEIAGFFVIGRDTTISPWSAQEVELVESITNVLTAAFEKSTMIGRLQKLSSEDALTSLLNRGALEKTVDARLSQIKDPASGGVLLFVDLDNFKEVNDTLGHHAGDDAIRYVAEFIKAMIRPADIAGRYGGDEFIIWLEAANEDVASQRARELINVMPAIRKKLGNSNLKLSASVGICSCKNLTERSFEKLASLADEALYNVKTTGKGNIGFANELQAKPENDYAATATGER